MNRRIRNSLIGAAAGAVGIAAVLYLGVWKWMICRVEVPPGHSLQLTYKGPWPPLWSLGKAEEGTLAQTDDSGRPMQVGVLEEMPGPGRHFYSPLEYKYEMIEDIDIKPGEIGVVTAKVGKPLPQGQFLADEGQRGIRRRVLTPGRYRINPYAYDVEVRPVTASVATNGGVRHRPGDALMIPAGYVGVVTNKAADSRGAGQGTQPDVLQPGIYYLNPFEKRVDILSIGYNETTLSVEEQRGPDGSIVYKEPVARSEALGAPLARDPVYVPGKGISFPSSDGFPIHLDFTTIWGILPDQAPDVVRQFGNRQDQEQNTLKVVEQMAILPAVESICRLNGSRHGAVDLLIGDSREAFQADTSEELEAVIAEENLTLLLGLVRHIYVPAEVREPIQRAKIADELKLTRDQEQLTAEAEGDLKEAKAKVLLEERRVNAETEKLVAEALAEGEKAAREIDAETERLVARIDAQTARIQAEITKALGEAEAKKTELANQAEAERYKMYVETLGGPDAYNRYMFAEGLPGDLRMGLFYAGEGTFWTDLKGFEQAMLGKLASESESRSRSKADDPAAGALPELRPASAPR